MEDQSQEDIKEIINFVFADMKCHGLKEEMEKSEQNKEQ